MNSSFQDSKRQDAGQVDPAQMVDRTLKLLIQAPVPEGIEDRVRERLRAASREEELPVKGKLLDWPVRVDSEWMRSAAAAAIVAIVAGGGWFVSSYAGRPQAAKAIVMPAADPSGGGGFSSAGAKRTPDTLNGPVLKHPLQGRPGASAKKPQAASAAGHTGRAAATEKPVQPSAGSSAK